MSLNPKEYVGGEKSFNIDAQGDIYPCTFVVGDTVHWIGNVFQA